MAIIITDEMHGHKSTLKDLMAHDEFFFLHSAIEYGSVSDFIF